MFENLPKLWYFLSESSFIPIDFEDSIILMNIHCYNFETVDQEVAALEKTEASWSKSSSHSGQWKGFFNTFLFSAVQNSSIGDLTQSLTHSTFTFVIQRAIFETCDHWGHLVRVMRRHDLTNKKTKTMTKTFREHPKRVTLKTKDPSKGQGHLLSCSGQLKKSIA